MAAVRPIWIAVTATPHGLVDGLRHLDSRVFESSNDLLARLRHEPSPGLVILDAADACATIRRSHATLPLLVIATGDSIDAAFDAGASDVLCTPFDEREVRARVRSLLARHPARERALSHTAEALAAELGQSERRLADERDKLAGVFEVSPAAMALWCGEDLVFDKVNPQYQAIFPGRQLLGRPLIEAVPELKGQPFPDLLRTVLATGTPFVGHEALTQLAGPDGVLEDHFYDFTYARIDDSEGRPLGVYDHAIDVTDRVLAHRQLIESQMREQKQRQLAEDANRSKDEFLAMLGHEMRNPLAPISTALELMTLRSPEDGYAKERAIIQRQVDHLTRLVDDLLDVSRITRGKIELSRVRVSLGSLVTNAVEIVSPLLEQRQHQLRISVPEDLALDADPVRIQQVISNLLTNAAKYTEPAGQIQIDAGSEGDELWLTVRDNGVGIDLEMLPHVFELFTQEPQSIERSRGGLGLGLAIVKSLVTMHDGSVSAESAGRGQGSRFTLRFPKASAPAAEARPPAPAPRPAAGSKRILIVDDNVDAAELLAMSLESRGHVVRVAHDGPEALRVVEAFTPDLALLDIGLPVMDGYELARRFRTLPALHRIRMVAITGYGQASDRQQSTDAGFDAHLVKPLDFDALGKLLKETPRA